MDATQGTALVSSSAISGQTYVLSGGNGRYEIIITGVDDNTAAHGPGGPYATLEGLQYRVSYSEATCDYLA